MKIYFAADHAGFELKKILVEYVKSLGFQVQDVCPNTPDNNDYYPDCVVPVAQAVMEDSVRNRGIILGGSGQGEAVVANRFAGVRAAVYYGGSTDIIRLSRQHNDANVLSLGARFLTVDEAKEAVKIWLDTKFSDDERHIRRIKKIDELTH